MKLDIEAVQAFVLIAKFKSFTQTADALGTTQSGVSLKIKRLEEKLGRRLLERTPRNVRLSADGEHFLAAARDLVKAYHAALLSFNTKQQRLSVGITHHIVGSDLPVLLTQVFESMPHLALELHVESSWNLMEMFSKDELDVAIVLCHAQMNRGGQILFKEPFSWFAAPDYFNASHASVRIASQAPPCSIRTMAMNALTHSNSKWNEVFTGGGVAAVSAAVSSGLAVAAMSRYAAPANAIDVTKELNLPPMNEIDISLHSNIPNQDGNEIISRLIRVLQSSRR